MFFEYNLRQHYERKENIVLTAFSIGFGMVLGFILLDYNLIKLGVILGFILLLITELIIYIIKPNFFKQGHAFLKRKLIILIWGNVFGGLLMVAVISLYKDNLFIEEIAVVFLVVTTLLESWLYKKWNLFDDKQYAQINLLNPYQKMYIKQPYGSWNKTNPNIMSYQQLMEEYKIKLRYSYIATIVTFALAILISSLGLNLVTDLKIWLIALIIISILLYRIIVLFIMRLEEDEFYEIKPTIKSIVLAISGTLVLGFISIVTSISAFAIIGSLFGVIG